MRARLVDLLAGQELGLVDDEDIDVPLGVAGP